MSVTILSASSAVKVTLTASNGLPANFNVFNADAGVVSVYVPPFVPGQSSIDITISRVAPAGGMASLLAQGVGYPNAPLYVTAEAVPNAFTWNEAGAVQVPA